jgi:hypothetical protein
MAYAWRILEEKDGKPHTLMHKLNGTHELPIDEWVEADIKPVRNPGSGGQKYISGFHCMLTREDVERYMQRFTKPRTLVICQIEIGEVNIRRKPGAKGVMLAPALRIPKGAWRRARESGTS